MRIELDQLPYIPDELYDNPMVEQTQSSISEFLICPQKYVFRYLMGLVPSGVRVYFLIGTAVHACLEFLLTPRKKQVSYDVRLNTCRKLIDDVFDKAVEQSDVSWQTNNDKMEVARAQAHAIVQAWQINYDWESMFKVLHTELNIRAKPGATIHSDLMDRGAGKIDGVVLDRMNMFDEGIPLILEHKTRYTLKDLDFVEGLSLDFQALWYFMLYEKWFSKKENKKKVKIGVMPGGFYYDAVSKPQHKMSNRTFDELVQVMQDAMVEKPDQYFSLTPIIIEPWAVERARKHIERIVKRIDNLNPHNVEMNTKACNLYGGCAYRKLCSAGADVSEPSKVFELPQLDMYRIVDVHEELVEEDAVGGE